MDETRDHGFELIAPVVAPGEAGEMASGMVGAELAISPGDRALDVAERRVHPFERCHAGRLSARPGTDRLMAAGGLVECAPAAQAVRHNRRSGDQPELGTARDLALAEALERGELDSREVWDEDDAIDALGEAIRVMVGGVTVDGTQMADEREPLMWGFVNMLHSQVQTGAGSPVFGFRPMRGPLSRTMNVPNEEIFTVSPAASRSAIVSMKPSTSAAASWRVTPTSSRTASIRSAFVTVAMAEHPSIPTTIFGPQDRSDAARLGRVCDPQEESAQGRRPRRREGRPHPYPLRFVLSARRPVQPAGRAPRGFGPLIAREPRPENPRPFNLQTQTLPTSSPHAPRRRTKTCARS